MIKVVESGWWFTAKTAYDIYGEHKEYPFPRYRFEVWGLCWLIPGWIQVYWAESDNHPGQFGWWHHSHAGVDWVWKWRIIDTEA